MNAAAQPADEYVPIPMVQVSSSQIVCVGYDAARKMLALQFAHGTGAEYQYPNVEPEVHAAMMAAESIGRYFGAHIKALPFKKYAPAKAETEQAAPAAAAAPGSCVPWPFPDARA